MIEPNNQRGTGMHADGSVLLLDELIDGMHRRAIVGLWLDIFNEFLSRSVFIATDANGTESGSELERDTEIDQEILSEMFSQLVESAAASWSPSAADDEVELAEERAALCQAAVEEITKQTVDAVFKCKPDSDEWPAHVRETLMEIWDDPNGDLLAREVRERRARMTKSNAD
jgi:hypothetical protein